MSYEYEVHALVTTPSGPESVHCTTKHPRPATERDIKEALTGDAARRHGVSTSKVTVQINIFRPL
ncbi:hypothetical protein ACWGHD_04440 [Streptomyces xanthophaeus]